MNTAKFLGTVSLSCSFLCAAALAQTLESIDPPSSVGTLPLRVHKGNVTGTYDDNITRRSKGFLFSKSGGYQTFEASSAGYGVVTYAVDSDDAGRVAGWFIDTDYHTRGFVRSRHGAITAYEVPQENIYTTLVSDMNGAGFIVGQYFLSSEYDSKGYLRVPGGPIVQIKIPGNEMVIPWAINDGGMIAGHFARNSGAEWMGFIRAFNGRLTTFAGPSDCGFGDGYPLFMNDKGELVGGCAFSSSSFLRKQNGMYVMIDYPAALWTNATGIASNGDIAGSYMDATQGTHGFIRRANGTFVSFDFPDAMAGSTEVRGMDDDGNLIGTYYGADLRQHGYIRYADCDRPGGCR